MGFCVSEDCRVSLPLLGLRVSPAVATAPWLSLSYSLCPSLHNRKPSVITRNFTVSFALPTERSLFLSADTRGDSAMGGKQALEDQAAVALAI